MTGQVKMTRPGLEFITYTGSIRGARPYQEDYAHVWRPNGQAVNGAGGDQQLLGILADGMGGHVSGEVASKLACTQYVSAFSSQGGPIDQRLGTSLDASNSALSDAIRTNSALNGMGCTLVAGYVDQDGLRWVSVGDSMLLLYRRGQLIRLNDDHSFGALLDKQAEAQKITMEEARNHPRRRSLRSAITGGQIALRHLEAAPRRLLPGDWVVLASDGLETLTGTEIAKLISSQENGSPQALVDRLLHAVAAKKSENQDNTTVLAIKVLDPSDQPTLVLERSKTSQANDFERVIEQPDAVVLQQRYNASGVPLVDGREKQTSVGGSHASLAALATALAASLILAWSIWTASDVTTSLESSKTVENPSGSPATGSTLPPQPDAKKVEPLDKSASDKPPKSLAPTAPAGGASPDQTAPTLKKEPAVVTPAAKGKPDTANPSPPPATDSNAAPQKGDKQPAGDKPATPPNDPKNGSQSLKPTDLPAKEAAPQLPADKSAPPPDPAKLNPAPKTGPGSTQYPPNGTSDPIQKKLSGDR